MKKLIKQRELNFWHFQITGWVLFEIVGIIRYFFYNIFIGDSIVSSEETIKLLILFIVSDSFAFCITIAMRYIYRFVGRHYFTLKDTIITILLTSIVMTALSQTFDLFFQQAMGYIEENRAMGIYKAIYSSSINIIVFFAWSGLYFGIKYWREWNVERQKAEKANFTAQTAQLQMLRYQLNPHFLFNSLNSISALMDEDKKKSKEMLCELAEFLRYSLESRNMSMVPLRQEIDATKLYLSIEKKRFEDKLEITYNIEEKAMDYPVLSFIIHPLVENAIKYGRNSTVLPLKLNISAHVIGESLKITVSNSGKWIDPSDASNLHSTGIGLQNIKYRLESAFGKGSYLHIEPSGDFVVATILITPPDKK